jgi:ABC-type multidrug transport system fused ATPase/permease subunit
MLSFHTHGPTDAPPGRLRRLERQFLRPHRLTLLAVMAGMFAQSLLLLPIPLVQGRVLDQLVAFRGGQRDDAAILAWEVVGALAATAACLLARAILAWRGSATAGRVSLEVARALTDALHRKYQRLPLTYFDREQTGQLMARITSDVGTLLIFLNGASLQLACDLVLAAGVAVALFWLNWREALVSLAVLPLYVANHRYFAGRLRGVGRKLRGQVAALFALLSERVSAVRVVRSFAQEEKELAELDRRIDAHRDSGWAGLRLGAWQGAGAVLLAGLGTVASLAYGVHLIATGGLSLGELLAFYALAGQLYNPLVRLTQVQAMLSGTLAAVDRIGEALEEPETLTERPDARLLPRPRGHVALRGVSFAYRGGSPRVLEGIDLEIEPGTKVAILGPSGSGKSTLLALVPRLYDLPAGCGAVLLDGHDVRDLRLADLRRAAVLVPQQAMLFEGTIRTNLTYARPDAPPQDVARALEVADLAAMVEALPRGLDTPVGERGFSLSGGQRQRLALARALIADPAVLLLDDCTSALDAETEGRIQAALLELLPDRTCVIVSHKVSSVCRADHIVVLEAGRVVEQGGHDELLQRGGAYARTHELQTRALAC